MYFPTLFASFLVFALTLVCTLKPACKDPFDKYGKIANIRHNCFTVYQFFKKKKEEKDEFKMLGFRKPKKAILGADLAGEIEAVGKDVKVREVPR